MKSKGNDKKKKYPRRRYGTGDQKQDRLIHWFIQKAGGSPHADLLEELMITVFKIRGESIERGDIKMLNTAFKELRYALKVFYPFRHVRKVAIFGSARTPKSSPQYKQARDFASMIVKDQGWMVITGASDGIMSAGNEGAGRLNSFGVNIRLPFEQDANPTIIDDPKLVNFKYFFTRKLIFMRESDATVLCPGGFGTHDEGFETLTLVQTGKTEPRPIICMDPPRSRYWKHWRDWVVTHLVQGKMVDAEDIDLIFFTHSAKDAVRKIADFYRNYQSMRYIGDRLILRIKKPLTERQLERLNGDYADIVKEGVIRQYDQPFKAEEGESPETLDLSRIAFHFNKRAHARLTRMIEDINKI
ncbi:MAG: LOG family protein [Candidatus Omnitrophota bacterium]|nr:LOG family protein [Candidatus Omnitrophota bacterium]